MGEERHLRDEHQFRSSRSACYDKNQQSVEDPRNRRHLCRRVVGQDSSGGSRQHSQRIYEDGETQRIGAASPARGDQGQQDVEGHQQGGYIRDVLLRDAILLELQRRHALANCEGRLPCEEDDEKVPHRLQRGHAKHLRVGGHDSFGLLSGRERLLCLPNGHQGRDRKEEGAISHEEVGQRQQLEVVQHREACEAHGIAERLARSVAGGLVVCILLAEHCQSPAIHCDVLRGAEEVHGKEKRGQRVDGRLHAISSDQRGKLRGCVDH
mmetsp:Transcript_25184/g.56732  ORF Transcript_25184/g.56732 Transcript_25184/m.56732 type:complete len:267 (+) Transcript_25184:326-1126(+)